MKEMISYGIMIGLICAVASGILDRMNFLSKSKFITQAQAQVESDLAELLPPATRFEPVKSNGQILYYKGYDKDNRLVGAVFKAAGKGYSGEIETMAGMTRDGKITFIKVIAHNETAGVGSRVTEPGFTGQFSGKAIRQLPSVQAITGATISSSAVINSVAQKAQELTEMLKNEK
jgi:electron transport complex protein RnfG